MTVDEKRDMIIKNKDHTHGRGTKRSFNAEESTDITDQMAAAASKPYLNQRELLAIAQMTDLALSCVYRRFQLSAGFLCWLSLAFLGQGLQNLARKNGAGMQLKQKRNGRKLLMIR